MPREWVLAISHVTVAIKIADSLVVSATRILQYNFISTLYPSGYNINDTDLLGQRKKVGAREIER